MGCELDQSGFKLLQENTKRLASLNGRQVLLNKEVGATTDGTVTIDQLASEYGPFDFIKIDVDGLEFELLKGAEQTLNNKHSTLMIETYAGSVADVHRHMQTKGYHPFRAMPDGSLLPLDSMQSGIANTFWIPPTLPKAEV